MSYYDNEYPKIVYAMQHKVTGRIYVGKTKNLDERLYVHLNSLAKGKHDNELMQEDVNKFGCDFDFFILDTVNNLSESRKELDWMDELNTGDKRVGYNYKDAHFRYKKPQIPIKHGIPIPNEIE